MAEGDQEVVVKRGRRPRRRTVLLLLGPLLALAVAAYAYATGGRYVGTENAYVTADMVSVAADVSGLAVSVDVEENQLVKAGEPLLHIDPEPYRLVRDRARAQLEAVKREIEAQKAAYAEKLAERRRALDTVAYFKREYERQKTLAGKGIASTAKFDAARHALDDAQRTVVVIDRGIERILAGLGGDAQRPVEEYPQYQAAKADLERAELNLKRTVVRAPVTGYVAKHDLEPGEFIAAGKPVLGLVGAEHVWIEANLKETDLTHLDVGQSVVATVDAYPDVVWRGHVESIGPATGSQFALLPAQNASGNWVKVVQRVPVRLAIDIPADAPTLRAGMSAKVEIDTEHHRKLPTIVGRALAWAGAGQ